MRNPVEEEIMKIKVGGCFVPAVFVYVICKEVRVKERMDMYD